MKSLQPLNTLPATTNFHSLPQESTNAPERNGNRGVGLRNFLSNPLAVVLMFLASILGITPPAQAHNLDQLDTSIAFDKATLDMMAARAGLNQPLVQAGDSLGLILKSTPGPGTATGAGGYMTFYIPPGTQVEKAEYGRPTASGTFAAIPMKGPSIMAIGDGSVGSATTAGLVGLTLGPNAAGVTASAVSAAGVHNGTLAGVYGDVGIFYSTDPKTVWQSFVNTGGYDRNTGTSDNVLTNNRGEARVPITKWDAEQLIGFGLSAPALPVLDPNGRGNSPWGTASAVAGPQSGYQWAFNRDIYLSNPANLKASIVTGPWNRIQYPGSTIAKDQVGLKSTALGFATADASTLGTAISPASPLPQTLNWTDNTSPKALRVSYGGLVLGQSEYARVQLKILAAPGQPNSPFDANGCFFMNTDTFGGDAGGEQGGKDHLWRYYDPTTQTINTCAMLQKQFAKTPLAPGETSYFEIAVINTGTTALTNVVVTDPMPLGLTYVSAVPAPSSTSPLTWTLGTVPAQGFVKIRVNVTATGSGVIFNTASMNSSAGTRTAMDSVDIGIRSILEPTKSVTPSSTVAGATVTYAITINNIGTGSNGTPLVLTDVLPAGFSYGSVVSSKLNGAAAAAGVVSVNGTDPTKPVFTISQGILPGKSLVITMTGIISGSQAPGTYGNTVSMNYEGKVVTSGSLAPVTVGGGRIGDTIFRDWDGDGTQDAGEEGLPGVTVTLTYFGANGVVGGGDDVLTTTATDAGGAYQFTNLVPGNYQVSVPAPGSGGVPSAYTLTADPDGGAVTQTSTKTLALNEVYLAADWGYRPGGAGSIGDKVFEDLNNNGSWEIGEPGIPNVTVQLRNAEGNNVRTAVTDGSGNYSFSNLPLGLNYSVICGLQGPTTYFGSDPFAITTSNPIDVASLAGSVTTVDFGFYRNLPATVGDLVYFDADNSGGYNAGDSVMPNVTVLLRNSTDTATISTTTTAIDGTYHFTGLIPGTYVVKVDTADTDIPGNYAIAGSGIYNPVPLTSGQIDSDRDFRFVAVPSPLTKAVNLANASRGANLTYTLTPNYTGNSVLTNVQVIDATPAGTTYVNPSANPLPSAQPSNGGTGSVTWNLGSTTAAANGGNTISDSAAATITERAHSTASDTTTTTLAINKPAGVVAGDVMIANINLRGGSITYPSLTGWNTIANENIEDGVIPGSGGKEHRNALLYRVADGTEGASFTFALGSSVDDVTGAIVAFSGVDTTGGVKADGTAGGPFDVDPGSWSVGTATTSITGVTAIPNASLGSLIAMFVGTFDSATSVSACATATSPGALNTASYSFNAANGTVGGAWKVKPTSSATSTGAGSATLGASKKWGAMLIALKPGSTTTYNYTTSTALSANRSMVKTGDIITVTMTVTATGTGLPVTVTAGALNATGTNGASATFGAASPLTQSLSSGVPAIFTYTSTSVTAGSSPGILTFKATPTDTRGTWAQGTGNTVIATPAFSYHVIVNNSPAPAVVNNTAQITSTSGITPGNSNQVSTVIDASIGDFVWEDLNGDGLQAGETGISGVRVFIDLDADGIYDAGVEPTATTDATGFYRIIGLNAGNYSVRYDVSTLPVGYVPSTPLVHSAVIAATEQYSAVDFGLRPPGTSTIGDTVWIDANEDGVVNAGEVTLANIDVHLYADLNNNGLVDAGDLLLNTTSTDTNGNYLFTSLSAGSYVVDVVESDPQFPVGLVLVSGGSPVTTSPANGVWQVDPANGQTILTADFGYNYNGRIGDYVWYDLNGDKIQNNSAGEVPVPNAVVTLYGDTNNNGELDAGEPILGFTTTSNSGAYLFDNLPPGNYIVKVEEQEVLTPPSSPNPGLPARMQASTGTKKAVALAAGQDYTAADFGFLEVAKVEGHVFYDANGNGVLDPSESILPNVTVTLVGTDANGAAVSMTTTTGVDGMYVFLPPAGTYTVAYNTADPDIPVALATRTTPVSFLFSIASGNEVENLNFGVDNTGTIGDTIFANANSNATQDSGEPGLANVLVNLYSDAGRTILLDSKVTDDSGKYLFTGLADGTYYTQVVTSTLPAGYNTTPTADPDATKDSLGTAAVASGGAVLTQDFGYTATVATFAVSGTIFKDLNTNGAPNVPGEQLTGVTVTAVVTTGAVTQTFTTTTDPNGLYTFAGIPTGSNVAVTVSPSTLGSPAYVQTVDPDATINNTTSITNVTGDVTGKNFGYVLSLGSIAGTVVKGDGDGLAESGEPVQTNVTVTLIYAGNDGIEGTGDDQTFTMPTNGTGDYLFTGLLPGNYSISTTVPSGFAPLADRDGTNPNSIAVALAVGQNKVDQDFEYQASSISDYVWNDSDGDGVQEASELPLSGVRVYVDLDDSTTYDVGEPASITDASGFYLISGLSTGTYSVRVDTTTLPAGTTPTYDLNGIGTPHETNVVLAVNEDRTDVDFGYRGNASIGDFIWNDTNGNGNQDPGEMPLTNVVVFIDRDGNGLRDANEPSATTNGFGIYSLNGLVPGTYTVAVDTTTIPAGANQTGDPDGTFNNQTTVTLSAGEHEDTADFGYQSPLFSISGQVRNDTDVDGDLADSETGLAAVVIKLYTDPDGDGDPADGILLAVTYTDGSGNYFFNGLPDGNYAIVETNPSGAISTADAVGANDDQIAVTIAASNVTGRDFLDAIAPENLHLISGTVYDDGPFNDDSFSADDNPIAAVTVSLYADVNANGNLDPGIDLLIQSNGTNLLGGYGFAALPDGAYLVVETDPVGSTSESDTEGSLTDNVIAVTLANNNSFANDFLDDNTPVLFISGQIRNDMDCDGDPADIDPGINGVKVTIYTDPNGDGNPEDGAELGFTITAFGGSYQFNNLPPGTYLVTETDPAGASSTYDVFGSPSDNKIPVNLSVSPAIHQDFLDDAPILAGISGHVFDDGIPDDNDFGLGDNPVSAVKLFLIADINGNGTVDQNDQIIDVALTDALGYYHFDELPNGNYVVNEIDPIDASSENDVQGSPFDNEVAVALSGAEVAGRDFLDDGLVLHVIRGQVRDDWDEDGDLTDADLPVGGVVVRLFADTNGDGTADPSEVVASTTTGGDGRYVFTNLPDGNYLVVETDPASATSTADVSGSLTDNLITLTLAGTDSIGNDFLDAVDPSGYIYASATGQIVPGGTIQLTGPGVVNILTDGSTGQYSFLTDGTAGTYTLSYTPPAGYIIDPTRPEAGPFFDPSGGPDPAVLGSGEDPGKPGYLLDYSAGTNTYYFTLELAPGDPLVINNNIPLVEIKPTNWAEWQYQNELGGNNGPTQNADGDLYDNLQEYAFCLPGNNGLNAHCPLEVIVNGASIDANITTVTGITDATYTLEYIADLRNSSANGGGWTPVTTIVPTSVDNPDGTTTVTYADLESLPGLSSGHGFVRVIVDLASPATTTRTYAAGWQDRAFTQNCETFSNPFLKCEIFSGAVTSNTSSVIDLSGSIPLGSIRAQLINGRSYYAEVTAGPLVGNRWWIVNASSTAATITVSTGTTALTANALVGSSIVVREAHTFAEMFPPADFHAGNSLVTADKILVYDPSTPSKWVNYFLADLSGAGLGIHWVRSTDPITNRDATPLDACQGIFIHHRAATVYTTLVGQVRENQIACPLKPGYNLVGGGYPVIQTPYDRAMTWDGSTFNGFVGSIDSARSDTLLFWKGDYTLGAENYINYWLVDAGFDPYRRWALQEDNSVLSQDTTDLFDITRGAFYETETGNPGYIMPAGWTP